jgi:hypothetical protein
MPTACSPPRTPLCSRTGTFGGLALGIREQESEWEVEDADAVAVALPARYRITYRTLANDLSTLG